VEEDLPSQWYLKPGIAIFILDEVHFKCTLVKRDKEGYFMLIKEEIHQKEITTINLYAPNVSDPISSNIC
jgi:hypothetical protein